MLSSTTSPSAAPTAQPAVPPAKARSKAAATGPITAPAGPAAIVPMTATPVTATAAPASTPTALPVFLPRFLGSTWWDWHLGQMGSIDKPVRGWAERVCVAISRLHIVSRAECCASPAPSEADAEERSCDKDDRKGGEEIKWRAGGDQGNFPFKDAGVLVARLRVDRRQLCGIKPSWTVMAKPGRRVDAERTAGMICQRCLLRTGAKVRRCPCHVCHMWLRFSAVHRLECSSATAATEIRASSQDGPNQPA